MIDDDAVTESVTPNRRRRRWRIIAAIAIVLVLGIVIQQIIWYATAQPMPVVDYLAKMNELVQQYQPEPITDDNNAWPEIIAAAQRLGVLKQQAAIEHADFLVERSTWEDAQETGAVGDIYVMAMPYADDPGHERWAPERAMLAAIEEDDLVKHVRTAAERPVARRTITGQTAAPLLLNVVLPTLSDVRELARHRGAAMHVAAARGDGEALLRAFDDIGGLGRHMTHQFTIIDRLVGTAIHRLALDQLFHILLTYEVDAQTLRMLRGSIDRQMVRPPLDLQFEAERLLMLDTIQWIFTDNGHGDGRMHVSELNALQTMTAVPGPGGGLTTGSSTWGTLAGIFLPGRRETTETLNQFWTIMKADAHKTPAQRARDGLRGDVFVGSLPQRHVLLRLLLPAIGKLLDTDATIETTIAGMRIVLAVEEYRAVNDALPAALDDLAPDLLTADQLIDPANGQRFIYHPFAQTSAQGLDYIVYSMGADGVDDHADIDFAAATKLMSPTSPFGSRWSYDVMEPGRDMLISEPLTYDEK